MIIGELTYYDILQSLNSVKNHCEKRHHCKGCIYSGNALANDEPFSYCAIRRNPDHWQTDIIKMNIEETVKGV